MSEFLLIDGSYYIFYRYHALIQWWKHANSDNPLPDNPCDNEEFIEKFKKIFISKITEIKKKLKLKNPMIMVAQDCPRENIWRNKIFPDYKKQRVNNTDVGQAFKCVYTEDLFKKAGAHLLIKHPELEADDCIALTVKNLRKLSPTKTIYIITSDMDYLQIADDITIPTNLKYSPLQDSKQSFKNSKKDLFCKIVMGDKSDCIPSVFKKCGIKTAEKYFNNEALFIQKIESDDQARKQYELNKQLIDFNNIPKNLVTDFNTGKYTNKLV